MATKVPNVTLNNGVDMPILGFGVYQIPPEDTERAVTEALEVGYRHIDTAAAYFNEEEVGRAIKNSGIPRDELFLTTKMWIIDGGEDWAKRALDASLQRLGLDYLDLYLIHQPLGDYYSSWRAMEDLHRQGVLKAIGVSNFYPDRLVDSIDHNEITPRSTDRDPPVLPTNARSAVHARAGCADRVVGAVRRGTKQPVRRPGAHGDRCRIRQVRRPGSAPLAHSAGVIVIPKSVRRERMAENFDVFDFDLSADEMARLATMDAGISLFLDHRDAAWVSQLGSFRAD